MLKLKTSLCKLSEQGLPCVHWVALNSISMLTKVELPANVSIRATDESLKHTKIVYTSEELTEHYKKIRDAYGNDVSIIAVKAYPKTAAYKLAISAGTYILTPENSQFNKDDCYWIEDIVSRIQRLYMKNLDSLEIEFMNTELNGLIITGVTNA